MSKSTITPGPWFAVEKINGEVKDNYAVLSQPTPVLRGFTKEVAKVEGEANARAIAALPDLMEAAEPIAAILDGMAEHSKTHAAAVMVDTDLIRSLRSALLKAKGGE